MTRTSWPASWRNPWGSNTNRGCSSAASSPPGGVTQAASPAMQVYRAAGIGYDACYPLRQGLAQLNRLTGGRGPWLYPQKLRTSGSGLSRKALKLFPWVCGRCSREFVYSNLRELTVHHIDHDHSNNPEDGSNWEMLCLYCHDHEHSKYTEADQYGSTVVAGEDAQKSVGEAPTIRLRPESDDEQKVSEAADRRARS